MAFSLPAPNVQTPAQAPSLDRLDSESDGSFTAPPEPVFNRYAVYRKDNGKVVAFKMIEEGQPVALTEPASFEYAIVECPDESVVEGWSYTDGEFVAAGRTN